MIFEPKRVRAGTLTGVTVSLHHIVIDAHDLPAQARFWAQVLDWRILSEREREIVIGTDETAPVGICFMPVTDTKTVKNRLHLDLSPGPDRAAPSRGSCSPTLRGMSSASCARRRRSSPKATGYVIATRRTYLIIT